METKDESFGITEVRLGFWSASFSATFAVMYIAAEMAHLSGLLGPHDSPESLVVRMTPSLLLAMAFVMLMVTIHACASKQHKIWAHIALVFAVIYAVLVSIVYFVELTVVVPRTMQGEADQVALLEFGFGTFMFAIDILGYFFMSLATLFAAPVFDGRGLERWIRWALVVNGVLAPAIALQIIYPPLWNVAAVWVVSFPASTVMLAVWYRRTPPHVAADVGLGGLEHVG